MGISRFYVIENDSRVSILCICKNMKAYCLGVVDFTFIGYHNVKKEWDRRFHEELSHAKVLYVIPEFIVLLSEIVV